MHPRIGVTVFVPACAKNATLCVLDFRPYLVFLLGRYLIFIPDKPENLRLCLEELYRDLCEWLWLSVWARPERAVQADARDVFSQMMIVNNTGAEPYVTVQAGIGRRA